MLLSLAGYVMGGDHRGWLGERILLGENELAGFCNAQQVFLPLMEDDDCPGTLHEVSHGDPVPWRIRHWSCGWGRSGFWGLCHAALHHAYDDISVLL